MNENKAIISSELITRDDLDCLVEQIARMKHADVEIEDMFVVTSDDPSLLAALDVLFAPNGVMEKKAMKKETRKIKKRAKIIQDGWKGNGQESEPKPEPTRGPHVRLIKVNGTGEMISRFELNKRLAEHTIEPGTELHSPKHGKTVVKTTGNDEDPFVLTNEAGEQL